ncbi:MAG: FtsQ-type POTRA domain-containing protein [Chitinispirillaceae bacterium]|nr:FtsQ-type POTRA domain-containing protein [Chitinispirillaceae bacterium]
MAKRKGINSRKKTLQRKKKVVSKVRRVLPLIGIGVAILAALAGAWFCGKIGYGKLVASIDGSSLFSIKKITVTGNERITAASIIEQSNIAGIRKLYQLKPDSIVAVLSADPWIGRVRCLKRWWGEVVIEVKERKPVALVHSGVMRLADEQGVLLPVEPGKSYDLPLLTSVPVVKDRGGRLRCDSALFEQACRFITTVRREDDELMNGISQIDMGVADAACCRFAAYDAVVTIGCATGTRQLQNLRRLLEVLGNRSGEPAVIDMRYQNLAFVENRDSRNGGSTGVN